MGIPALTNSRTEKHSSRDARTLC